MDETEHQRTIEELVTKNYALLEELSQCNADKEFVWNLWRRLQSSQPEVTSVVSMVIAREKEKSEIKDKKVLEILQMKDEKIKELKERILSADDEAHYSKTRYHDLLIENEELKQQLDQKQTEFSAKEKELNDEKSYISSLLKAHQTQKELDDERAKENRDSLEEENIQLKAQIVSLERHIGELSEEKLKLATAIEANASLEEKIRSLENEVEDLTAKSADIARKYDEAEGKLNEKEELTQDQLTSLQKQSEKICERENEIMNLNQKLENSKESYREASEELSKQAIVIQQLQTIQNDNQRTFVEREKKYKKELSSLQTSVADLQAQCSLYLEKETKLQKDIEKLEENSVIQKEEISVKDMVIRELKDALRDGIQSEVSKRDGRVSEFSAGDRDSLGKEGTRTDRSKSRALVDQHTTDAKETQGGVKGDEGERKEEFKKQTREVDFGNTTLNQERVEDGFKLGILRELEAKLTHRKQTVDELKRLLELKEAELVETRRAHSQRHQRYRMLKENYQLILEQLKTYETSGAEDSQRPQIERPDERDLRHLDSDQVWKELAYYKKEYEALAKERHDVLEEIDLLRVQHANNVASIQELRVLLSEEREENIQAWNKIEAEKEAVHAAQREVERLEDQMESWQDKALQGQKIANEFDEENQLLKQEIKNLQGQNKTLSREFNSLKEEVDRFKEQCDEEISKERDKGRKILAKLQEEELTTETEKEANIERLNEELTKQQKESLSVYDAQVRRIADRILAISPKRAEESITTTRVTQETQTEVVPRFINSAINVNLDSENVSSVDEEEALDMTISSKNIRVAKVGGVGRKIVQQTPQPRKVLKKTPGRNEWASMKQRILSLTQEVSALRQSKDKALKAANQHKENSESLQMECNSLLQKLQVSKNSVQRLTEACKKCQQEKDLLVVQLNERREHQPNVVSISEWKHLEDQLRFITSECTRLSVNVRTLESENEQLKVRLKYAQGNTARLENAISQKKTLLNEVKTKMKDAEEKAKGDSETVKNLEEKVSQLREREKNNKLRIETLEHRLESECREIQNCKQELLYYQEQLKKTSQQLHRSHALRNQAKVAVSEMEAAATKQLKGLANQSEATITSLQRKLEQTQERVEEFHALLRTLVEELIRSLHSLRSKVEHQHEKQWKEASRSAVQEAQTKACAILNISSSDLEDIMEGRGAHLEEAKLRTEQKKAWMAEIESCLKRQGPFAVPLLEVLLDLINERVALEIEFAAL